MKKAKITVTKKGTLYKDLQDFSVSLCPECCSCNIKVFKTTKDYRFKFFDLIREDYKRTNYRCIDCDCHWKTEEVYKRDFADLIKVIISLVAIIGGGALAILSIERNPDPTPLAVLTLLGGVVMCTFGVIGFFDTI